MLGLKSWDLQTFCVFIVDVASVGRFPIAVIHGHAWAEAPVYVVRATKFS